MGNITIAQGSFLVTSVFSMFGGFIFNIVPPVEFSILMTGGLQLTGFIILILIYKRRANKSKAVTWLIPVASILFIVSLLLYINDSDKVIQLHESKAVKGEVLHDDLISSCKGLLIATHADCEAYLIRRLPDDESFTNARMIWTSTSVFRNEIKLSLVYSILVLSFCAFIFSVINFTEEINNKKNKDRHHLA